MDNLPLLELFTRLRDAGFPLGVDDYQAALESLQAGFGIGDRAALARLCRTLWVKSEEEQRLFDYHFERSIIPEVKPSPALLNLPVAEQSSTDDIPIEPFNLAQVLATLGVYAFPASVVLLTYILSTLMGRANHYPTFTGQPVERAIYGTSYKYDIKAEDIDGDALTIEAWLSANGQKYKIDDLGVDAGTDLFGIERQPLDYPTWLKFKDHGDGTATLFGNVEQRREEEKVGRTEPCYRVELQVKDQRKGADLQGFKLCETDQASIRKQFHILWLLLIYAATPVILYLIYRRSQISPSPSSSDTPATPPAGTESTSASERLPETADELRVTSPALPLAQTRSNIARRSFRQTNEYFPVTRRQMKQSWRSLRRLVRTGPSTELDIDATIDRIGRQGTLLEPVLIPRRVNQSKLLLLIDQDGSMVPFHAFSERLTETAVRGGQLESTKAYYFHNCPMDYLYGDRYCNWAETIDDVLNTVQSSHTKVLIFSDAGAARGTFNAERLELTIAFLTALKRQIRYVAWLNPIPSSRWQGTTASQIARFVPMFELNRRGLSHAMSVLRGRFR
jgi:uncharacterized protein with von Willebrand factor type A (vWA) domain